MWQNTVQAFGNIHLAYVGSMLNKYKNSRKIGNGDDHIDDEQNELSFAAYNLSFNFLI